MVRRTPKIWCSSISPFLRNGATISSVGFPLSCLLNISGNFQDSMIPKRFFSRTLWLLKPSNVKLQINSSYLLCIYSVTVQSIAKRLSQVAKKLFSQHTARILHTFIYTWCSIHKRHVGFVESQVKSRTFQDQTHFPGLSRSWTF